ncbi:hypothetical protein [Streptomyces luteogriseus]|uniref:hypothetical protein n=1 Tax=Streptomyces luteogriseus TaxID=68233 RepID=UPI003826DDE7
MLEGLDGDLAGAVAWLVDGEGHDQGGDHVGVGGTVGQRGAMALGVAGDDKGGVVAEEALLDPLGLLIAVGLLPAASSLDWGQTVQGEGILVAGGADVPAGVGVGGGGGAVDRQTFGVGADGGGVEADRAVPALFQQGQGLAQGHAEDHVGHAQKAGALASECLRVCLGQDPFGVAAGQAVVLRQRGRVDGLEDAVQAAADHGVGRFEAAVVVRVAVQAELIAHRAGQGEVQQVGDSGEGDDSAVALSGQGHADQQGFH